MSAVEVIGGEHDGKIVLRARVREHLDAVLELAPEGAATAVNVTPRGDYRYRSWITRLGFEKMVVALAREVTYPNFKDAVMKREGRSRYESALHRVWSVMAMLQPRGPYGTGGSGYPPAPKGEAAEARKKPRRSRPAHDHVCHDCGSDGDLIDIEGRLYCRDVSLCIARARRD